MKLHVFVVIALLCVCGIAHPEPHREDFSVAQKEWAEEDAVELQIEEKSRDNQSDGETETKRPKQRSGARRRRRMRKRYRTTTEFPQSDGDDVLYRESGSREAQSQEERFNRTQKELLNHEDVSEGLTTAEETPRRRPGKRRRRPHRKQPPEVEDSSSAQDSPPLKRRRKGPRRRPQPKDTTEVSRIEETSTAAAAAATTTTTTTTSEIPNVVIESNSNHKKNSSTSSTGSNEIKSTAPIKSSTEAALETEVQEDKSFGNKIYDRKSLFSKPRRLPETSVILRRKLGPRDNLTNDVHFRIIKPLSNLENELNFKENPAGNEVKTINVTTMSHPHKEKQNRVRQSYKDSTKKTTTTTTEEPPNYPKIKVETVTELPETTTFISVRVVTSTQVSKKIIEEPEVTTKSPEPSKRPPASTDDLFKNVNFTNINDSIIDLLKTENISSILKARNMTLTQLLDHRERGSSSFHLSDIFQKTATTETDEGRENSSSQISFPDEDVLGSFNRFLSDQIKQTAQVKTVKEPDETAQSDKREPRLFDSMPDFTSSTFGVLAAEPMQTTARIEAVPGWRVIPNPKLKPVSTRGHYKEIKLSQDTSEIPNLSNDIDNIYLLNEKNEISHKSKRGNQINVNNRSEQNRQTTGTPRIPIAVKSAIIISGAILALAIFAFLSVLVSCRVRQKKRRLRAKQSMLCEHMHGEDLTTSQQSLSPVLAKHSSRSGGGRHVLRQPSHAHPDATTGSQRHYYLWRTIRKTFRYD